MRCPKCKSDKIVALNQEEKHNYCPKCNHSWAVGKEAKSLKDKGTLEFNGVTAAQQIFEFLTGGAETMAPEMRAALESQMVGVIFEQWFEGFKAGQLANIIHVRDYYGKNSIKPSGATNKSGEGTSGSPKYSNDGEDSSTSKEGVGTEKRYQLIKERVAGYTFEYPKHIKVPENVYQQAAEVAIKLTGETFMFFYDGRALDIRVKTGK